MRHEILIAGFGGQGVLSVGEFLAYAGMLEGQEVAWVPSYGPEMRGGTSNCMVTLGDEEIDSPLFEQATGAIIMNQPSLVKFEPIVEPGGVLLLNSSLVKPTVKREDIHVYEIAANEIAAELGTGKVANIVMLGAFLKVNPVVKTASVLECLKKVFPVKKHHLIPLNEQAMAMGAKQIKSISPAKRQVVNS